MWRIITLAVLLLVSSCATTGPSVTDTEPQNLGTEGVARALDIWEDFRQDEKEQLLKRSLEINPNPITYHLLGQLYLGAQRYEEAKNAYSEATKRDSSFARGFFELGQLGLWHLPDQPREEALANLRQAFALDPANPHYGLFLADQLRWDENTLPEAVEVFETLASPRQGDPMVFIAYAQFLLDTDNRSKAQEILNRAKVLTDLSGNLYHSGAILSPLYRSDRLDEAEFFLSRLESSGEQDYWLYVGVGGELFNQGYFAQAYRLLVRALDLQNPLEGEHQFYLGLGEFLIDGSTNHLETFVSMDETSLYATVAQFVLAQSSNSPDTQARYQAMVQRIESEWGPVNEKMDYVPWLAAVISSSGI